MEDRKLQTEKALAEVIAKALKKYITGVLQDFNKVELDGKGYDFYFKLRTDLDSLQPPLDNQEDKGQ